MISAMDGHSTIFSMLEGKYLSEQLKKAYDSWELFTPLVQVSFGINLKIDLANATTTFIAKGKTIGPWFSLVSGLMNFNPFLISGSLVLNFRRGPLVQY